MTRWLRIRDIRGAVDHTGCGSAIFGEIAASERISQHVFASYVADQGRQSCEPSGILTIKRIRRVAFGRGNAVVAAERLHLTVSARYRLKLLSRGPRQYGVEDYQCKALSRRGLIAPLPDQSADGTRRWAITDDGLTVLQSYIQPIRKVARQPERSAMIPQERRSIDDTAG